MPIPPRSDASANDFDASTRRQLALDFVHEPAHGEVDFLVGEGNTLAYQRLMAFPDWAEPLTLIIGPAKSGKSHLARIFVDRSGALSIAPKELEVVATAGGNRPLVIEDVDRIGYSETAFFHLLNQSMRDRRPVLMTAREGIENWPYLTDDLLSRARRAVSYDVATTDDIALSQMFVKLFGDRQIAVEPKVIVYLVSRMERSSEEAVALCELLDRLALERGTAITRKLAAEALERRRADRDGRETDDWESDFDERDE